MLRLVIISVVILNPMVLANDGVFAYGSSKPDFTWMSHLSFLKKVLIHLQWRDVIVITDKVYISHIPWMYLSPIRVGTLKWNGFNISVPYSFTKTNCRFLVWCDDNCSLNVFSSAATSALFHGQHSWIFILPDIDVIYKNTIHLREDTQLMVIEGDFKNASSSVRLLKLDYSRCVQKLVSTEVANSLEPLKFSIDDESKLFLLNHCDFKVGLLEHPPLQFLMNDSDGNVIAGGLMPSILKILAETLNFNYTFIVDETRTFGGKFQNGSFRGITGMLHRKVVDFISVGYVLNHDRLKFVEFSPVIITSEMVVIVKAAGQQSSEKLYDFTTYFNPFSTDVWKWIIITMLLMVFSFILTQIFKLLTKINPKNFRDILAFMKMLRTSIFKTAQTFEFHTNEATFIPTSQRISVAIAFLFFMVMACFYQASLTATLIVTAPNFPYERLEDLLEVKSFQFSVDDRSTYKELVEYTKSGPFPAVWARISANEENSLLKSRTIGFTMALKGEHAHLEGRIFAGPHLRNHNCSLVTLKQHYFVQSLHFGFRKHAPFNRILNFYIGKIRSSGILQRLRKTQNLISNKAECAVSNIISSSVELNKVVMSFAVLSSGIGMSVLVLAVEIAVYHRHRKHAQ